MGETFVPANNLHISWVQKGRCILFKVCVVLSVLAWAPIFLIGSLFGYHATYRLALVWLRFHYCLVRRLLGLSFSVHGQEHLPQGPVVVLSKHQSALETLTFQLFMPRQTWVIKRELLGIPVFGWCLKRLRPIHIDRASAASALKDVLRQGADHLIQGTWVIIFPEGTRVEPGKSKPYFKGGALLAKRARVPVVPIAHNTGEYWLNDSPWVRAGRCEVRIGEPIDTTALSPAEINQRAQDWIEGSMNEISEFR